MFFYLLLCICLLPSMAFAFFSLPENRTEYSDCVVFFDHRDPSKRQLAVMESTEVEARWTQCARPCAEFSPEKQWEHSCQPGDWKSTPCKISYNFGTMAMTGACPRLRPPAKVEKIAEKQPPTTPEEYQVSVDVPLEEVHTTTPYKYCVLVADYRGTEGAIVGGLFKLELEPDSNTSRLYGNCAQLCDRFVGNTTWSHSCLLESASDRCVMGRRDSANYMRGMCPIIDGNGHESMGLISAEVAQPLVASASKLAAATSFTMPLMLLVVSMVFVSAIGA